jgi:Domain of unknown function (DUF1906)
LNAVQAPYPATGVDCVTVLDAGRAQGLKEAGMAFAIRYLGSITAAELATILQAGLLVGLVTYADQWDGPTTVARLRALGIPAGVTVWLDVESTTTRGDILVEEINEWAGILVAAGYQPGMYVGANTPLTAQDIYGLAVVRYWRSMSLVPEPQCGYCLQQCPTTTLAGTEVDVDYTRPDYAGRLPSFVGA